MAKILLLTSEASRQPAKPDMKFFVRPTGFLEGATLFMVLEKETLFPWETGELIEPRDKTFCEHVKTTEKEVDMLEVALASGRMPSFMINCP